LREVPVVLLFPLKVPIQWDRCRLVRPFPLVGLRGRLFFPFGEELWSNNVVRLPSLNKPFFLGFLFTPNFLPPDEFRLTVQSCVFGERSLPKSFVPVVIVVLTLEKFFLSVFYGSICLDLVVFPRTPLCVPGACLPFCGPQFAMAGFLGYCLNPYVLGLVVPCLPRKTFWALLHRRVSRHPSSLTNVMSWVVNTGPFFSFELLTFGRLTVTFMYPHVFPKHLPDTKSPVPSSFQSFTPMLDCSFFFTLFFPRTPSPRGGLPLSVLCFP